MRISVEETEVPRARAGIPQRQAEGLLRSGWIIMAALTATYIAATHRHPVIAGVALAVGFTWLFAIVLTIERVVFDGQVRDRSPRH